MAKLIKNFRLLESNRGDKPFAVDREKGVIPGVKIIGKISANNREYTSDALSKAKPLYEGAKVYFDHPDKASKASTRSYRDGFGELRNIHETADGLFGDLHYNRKHPLAEQVAEDAERFPGQFGLSHNADGQARKSGGKWIVESIDVVHSVDLVGRPATNKGLFESASEPQERRRMKITIRSLVESVEDTTRKSILSKRLTEMAGDMAPVMDAPVDAPDAADMESGGSEDQIDAAFKAMVVGVLDDDSLDVAGKVAKIKLILTSQDKLLNGTSAAATPPADGSGDSTSTPATEGSAVEVGKLLEELKAERADMKSERLLESLGIEVTDARLKLLRTADEATRKELLEGWPKISKQSDSKPRPQPGRKLQEGVAADANDGAAAARRAFGLKSAKV